jgi:hypothetical protein
LTVLPARPCPDDPPPQADAASATLVQKMNGIETGIFIVTPFFCLGTCGTGSYALSH